MLTAIIAVTVFSDCYQVVGSRRVRQSAVLPGHNIHRPHAGHMQGMCGVCIADALVGTVTRGARTTAINRLLLSMLYISDVIAGIVTRGAWTMIINRLL